MQVKNKAPASIQITAEQILREAKSFQEVPLAPTRSKIADQDELDSYRLAKRKEFEDKLRRVRNSIGTWLQYAKWEAGQLQYDRARSIFERAIDVDYRNQSLWLRYADMEMRGKFINHARNVWDRAVQTLPRVDQFWYKYAFMEEKLGQVAKARQIFERWMQFEPDHSGWNSYVKLELRHGNPDRARAIFERYLVCHNEVATYLKFAKFEKKLGHTQKARVIYERALKELDDEANDESLFIAFAQFEEMCNEFERAREVFKYALDHVPKHRATALYQVYTDFEKKHGNRSTVEDVILSKRRFFYEEELKSMATNYDIWFDYVRLEETLGNHDRVREVYERAIANIPPVNEKLYWRRYVYLWINFAMFEELEAKDMKRSEAVLRKCLEIIPHELFTFAKIWLMLAHFYIRRRNLTAARRLLGVALGKCPKEKLFKGYIQLELQLGNIDRCRTLYQKYLTFMPANCQTWVKFAQLEASLSEVERARAVFEMAVNQPALDMPELLWKGFIDFEIAQQQHDRVRQLYARLLDRTKHVKVWISFAQFEAEVKALDRARRVFEEADRHFKEIIAKEERAEVLKRWLEFEKVYGDVASRTRLEDMQPMRVTAKRPIRTEDGEDAGFEEYRDYRFADEAAAPAAKLLEMARRWKKQRVQED
jgi:crooked neck